jgi:hypothetical protein
MKTPLRIDAEAEEEIAHAIDRYEREREGLGAEFWAELSDAMDALAESCSSKATRACALLRSCTGIGGQRIGRSGLTRSCAHRASRTTQPRWMGLLVRQIARRSLGWPYHSCSDAQGRGGE